MHVPRVAFLVATTLRILFISLIRRYLVLLLFVEQNPSLSILFNSSIDRKAIIYFYHQPCPLPAMTILPLPLLR
jgi:hypothetical protein